MIFVAVLGLLVILIFICIDIIKPHGYPPGPCWLPVVGNYPLLCQQLSRLGYHHLVWAHFAAQYGPVVGLRLGRDRIAVVSGNVAVREVLLRDEFDGRPDGFFFRLRTFGQRLGIVFTDGQLWNEQRRFSLHHLRKLGFGKHSMDGQIAIEASELVASLQEQCTGGTSILMHQAFDICVLNSLWAMLAGKRFELDDKRLAKLLDIVHTSFRMLDMSGGLLNQMPFLRYVAPKRSGYLNLLKILHQMWDFLEEIIAEHRNTLSTGHARDLIDSFLQEMEMHPNSTFTEKQLLSLCLDLFMAGSETTSNTLGFAVLYMLLHPSVQQRAHEELDMVVGRDRLPTLQDKPRLCYIDAVLMEVQRHVNIAPVAVPHRATKDTLLMGHTIPKGTTLLVSIWSLHMDEDHWGDPKTFRPERFLDSDGKLVQDDWFVPFGFGRRRCLGESLARKSLFLFFSTFLHSFSLSIPQGCLPPSINGYDGVTLSPKPFYAQLTPRF